MNLVEIGVRIKQCRKLQKLTQEKLAELIDVSPHYIYEIEKGLKCMSLSTLMDIASVLHASTDYILFGKPNDYPSPNTDRLNIVLDTIPLQKRKNIAEVLKLLIPYLK